MSYRVNFAQFHSVFVVPTSVVDDHLRLCGAVHLKILLLLMRNSARAYSAEELASAIDLSPGDVRDALHYWVEAGVVADDSLTAAANAVTPSEPPLSPQPQPPVPQKREIPPPPHGEKAVISSRPRLTRGEVIKLIQNDTELNQLLQEIQSAWGLLSSVEIDTVVALYSYYGLPADFILMVVHYCKTIGKKNMRYVEKTAATWVDQGIDTHEKAERHIAALMEKQSNEGQVRAAFGIGERRLIASEQKYVETWFSQYHFDISLIRLAYERTIENIGTLKFSYIHKILTSWHEKGITSTREAAEDMSSYKKERAAASRGDSSYDIDDLEKQIWDNLLHDK